MAVDVLIVDDSSAIRRIIQRVLHQADLPIGRILEASDGVEALNTLREHKVGLILTDINMPKMDGLQLLSEVKSTAEYKHIPVLIVTTEGSHAKVLESVNLGASGYVRKPFTPDQLKEKLASVLHSENMGAPLS